MSTTTTSLEELKKYTTVVVDSSDIDQLQSYKAQDATTNPSLVYQAAQNESYHSLIQEAIDYAKKNCPSNYSKNDFIIDAILTAFGTKILSIVPGRVSTEVDARLSFNTEASLARAHQIIDLYKERGISKERILIKLASTWEGIEAAKELQKEGIHCNMTLMFSLTQAIGAAHAKATLISPFVGRIFDWFTKNAGFNGSSAQDPGVLSVKQIFSYYKERGIPVQIMGASFRNVGEILELAGCDLLTISPKLLDELQHSNQPVELKLHKQEPTLSLDPIDEKTFRWELNQNQMATEKLSEGIRKFAQDTVKFEKFLKEKFSF